MRKPKTPPVASRHAAAEDRRSPEVIVDFLFEQGLFHVVVENISDVPAYSVSVRFDRPFRGLGGATDVSSLPLFRQITFLAPRKRIETFLDTSTAYFQRREPTRITAIISYRDARKGLHERRITHDLRIYKEVTYLAGGVGTNTPLNLGTTLGSTKPLTGETRYGSPQR